MERRDLLRIILVFLSLFLLLNIGISATAISQDIKSTSSTTIGNTNNLIIVDKNGKGDYTSIQEAINQAPLDSTLLIKKGTYDEKILIKKRITLQGEDKKETIISPISQKSSYTIRISASGVILRELSICNKATELYTMGIQVSASQTTIENCDIFDTPVGIAIWSSENYITHCTFRGCNDEGIALLGSTISACNDNRVMYCTFYSNCDGIELQYASYTTIANCVFYDNTHTAIDAIASDNNNNIISECILYNNAVHGIYISRSHENHILGCSLYNNKNGDIQTIGSDTLVKNCQMKQDSYIHIRENSLMTIENCNIDDTHIRTQNSIYTMESKSIEVSSISPMIDKKIDGSNNNQIFSFLNHIRDVIKVFLSDYSMPLKKNTVPV